MGQKPAGEQSQEIRKAWKRKRAELKGMPGTHGEIPGKRGALHSEAKQAKGWWCSWMCRKMGTLALLIG